MIGCADSIERIPWLGFRYDRWLERSPVESWEAYTRQTGQLGADWEDNLQDCSIRELASLQSLSTVGIWEVLLSRRFHTGLFLSGFCPGATFSTEIVPTLLLELHQIGNLNQSSRETNLVRRSIISFLGFMSRLDGILLNLAHFRYSHVVRRIRRQIVLLTEALREMTMYLT
jgi:hypothetical protein